VRFTPLVPPAIARAGTAQRAVPTDNIGMHRTVIRLPLTSAFAGVAARQAGPRPGEG